AGQVHFPLLQVRQIATGLDREQKPGRHFELPCRERLARRQLLVPIHTCAIYTAVGAVAELTIREATLDDAEAIARIYNQGIEARLAALETTLRSADERRDWLRARGERHPVLVCESDGRVVGWASLNPFNPRPAYDHVGDFSVYVARDARGSGVGS